MFKTIKMVGLLCILMIYERLKIAHRLYGFNGLSQILHF
jgi:hypothetical protein